MPSQPRASKAWKTNARARTRAYTRAGGTHTRTRLVGTTSLSEHPPPGFTPHTSKPTNKSSITLHPHNHSTPAVSSSQSDVLLRHGCYPTTRTMPTCREPRTGSAKADRANPGAGVLSKTSQFNFSQSQVFPSNCLNTAKENQAQPRGYFLSRPFCEGP